MGNVGAIRYPTGVVEAVILMTPEEARQVQFHLRSAAKILKANTPETELQDFERIELVARQHLLETVGPAMADVFFARTEPNRSEENEP